MYVLTTAVQAATTYPTAHRSREQLTSGRSRGRVAARAALEYFRRRGAPPLSDSVSDSSDS
eukprot:47598-Prymnesium_polylepis.1